MSSFYSDKTYLFLQRMIDICKCITTKEECEKMEIVLWKYKTDDVYTFTKELLELDELENCPCSFIFHFNLLYLFLMQFSPINPTRYDYNIVLPKNRILLKIAVEKGNIAFLTKQHVKQYKEYTIL